MAYADGWRIGVIGRLRAGLTCAAALVSGACAMPPHAPPAADPVGEWPALHAWQDTPAQGTNEAAEKEELAKKLNNPVADLISVPIQANYDHEIGFNDDGNQWLVNIQPVIPMSLNGDWNLISRTILPLYRQEDFAPGFGTHEGLGDITQSFFFSPKEPVDGTILGAGPVVLIPLASQDTMGGGKWGLGPTGVALRQDGPWTMGLLANHIWSTGGSSEREDFSNTFMQPFLVYTTKEAVSYGINTESTYYWKDHDWAIPINGFVTKVTRIGGQLVSIGGGVRYWADSPSGGPEGFGVRLIFTLLYPK